MDSKSIAAGVIQIDSTKMRAGQVRRRSQIVTEPIREEALPDEETPPWRPTEPHIVQIEMNSKNSFDVYLNNPRPTVQPFTSQVALTAFLKAKIRTAMLRNSNGPATMRDVEWESEHLTDRVLTLVANFRVANLDLNEFRAWDVTREMLEHEGNLKAKRGFLRR